jgi:hypothetical protein
MEEYVMSSSVLRPRDLANPPAQASVQASVQASQRREETIFRQPEAWSEDNFAREQVRGLVRQVFFSSVAHPVRQVVFTAAEPRTDVAGLCRQVGETLAQETRGTIAVVSSDVSILRGIEPYRAERSGESSDVAGGLQQSSIRARSNLWFVPETGAVDEAGELVRGSSWYLRLSDLRREFDYSVVQGPAAIALGNAVAFGQLADGIILVLAANSTRRAAARKIKETLEAAQVRLLGVVLSDRTFPIPERIYRRL